MMGLSSVLLLGYLPGPGPSETCLCVLPRTLACNFLHGGCTCSAFDKATAQRFALHCFLATLPCNCFLVTRCVHACSSRCPGQVNQAMKFGVPVRAAAQLLTGTALRQCSAAFWLGHAVHAGL